jgi:hypothetical protein
VGVFFFKFLLWSAAHDARTWHVYGPRCKLRHVEVVSFRNLHNKNAFNKYIPVDALYRYVFKILAKTMLGVVKFYEVGRSYLEIININGNMARSYKHTCSENVGNRSCTR